MLVEPLSITIVVVSLFTLFAILTQPNEILAWYVKGINESDSPYWVKKLTTCPYCLAGWFSLLLIIMTGFTWIKLLAFQWSVIITYLVVKKVIE